MQQNDWNYDELDDIYFQKSDDEIDCLKGISRGFSPKKVSALNFSKVGDKTYKGNQGKFLKSLQECLNWEKPVNGIADQYTNLMRIGYQPEVIQLNTLETVDEQIEWKKEKENAKKEEQRKEQMKKDQEQAINRNHLQWRKEQEKQRRQIKLEKEALMVNIFKTQQCSPKKLNDLPRKERTVTFDLRQQSRISQQSNKSLKTQVNQGQFLQVNLKNIQSSKLSDSPTKLSESDRSQMTAATSNYRYLHTPSPTKFRRDRQRLTLVADNILNLPQIKITTNSEFSKEDFSGQTFSPSANQTSYMPGQSLFDFNSIGSRPILSSRNVRNPISPMKRMGQNPGKQSSQLLSLSRLMNEDCKTVSSSFQMK